MRRPWPRILIVLLICTYCSLLEAAPRFLSQAKLKQILTQQGFSGGFSGKIQIKPLGIMTCGKRELQIYYYTWEETHPPSKTIHAAYRILLLNEAQEYLGQYKVEGDHPTMRGTESLVFPYPESEGNRITCDRDGPPATVLLNGEQISFEK